jgi:CheY-like chemotaxis protein
MPNKVLIADDSQTIRSVAEFLLRQKGYEVILAQDGEEALDLVKKTSPNLVLLDNSMPQTDGFTLCQELKKDFALKKIPVVMLLSSREWINQEGFQSSGCEGYILKPFSPREFLEKVEEFFNKEVLPGKTLEGKSSEFEEIKEPEDFLSELKAVEEERLAEKTVKPNPEEGNSYERFVSEFKREMEGLEEDESVVYREMKLESPEEKEEERFKGLDYEKLTSRIVKEVSTIVAEKITEKIDSKEIEQMIKEKIRELV